MRHLLMILGAVVVWILYVLVKDHDAVSEAQEVRR